jgi:glycosyltransferase involved in cell wall biosynthesis
VVLAVVMPVYNERALVGLVVDRVRDTPLPEGVSTRLIVLVDDGSTDGSRQIAEHLAEQPDVLLVAHDRNRGKGASIRTGFESALAAGADVAIIHDADMEYDPRDHALLVEPVVQDRADVVLGSRVFAPARSPRAAIHTLANRFLSAVTTQLTGLRVRDMECCLKAFRRSVMERISITEDRFAVEPELVAKAARLRHTDPPVRILEVPVSYAPRSHAQGKKITWKDGVSALRAIAKHSK